MSSAIRTAFAERPASLCSTASMPRSTVSQRMAADLAGATATGRGRFRSLAGVAHGRAGSDSPGGRGDGRVPVEVVVVDPGLGPVGDQEPEHQRQQPTRPTGPGVLLLLERAPWATM